MAHHSIATNHLSFSHMTPRDPLVNIQSDPHPSKKKNVSYYVLRFSLSLMILEFMLPLIPIPPRFEAGVWHGNSYRDQFWMRRRENHNTKGYRDEEWKHDAQRDRLLVLGDSRFYGQYIGLEKIFSTVVEKKTQWEVLNFGLPGASIYEADDFIIDQALTYAPQKAVMCYDINSSLYSIMTRAQGGSRHSLFYNIARSSFIFRWAELLYFSTIQGTQPVMSISEYEALLKKNITKLQNAGTEVTLVIGWAELEEFPNLYEKSRYELFRERSRTVAKELNLRTIDVKETLDMLPPERRFVGTEKMHFSQMGHLIFADTLIKKLNLEESHAP